MQLRHGCDTRYRGYVTCASFVPFSLQNTSKQIKRNQDTSKSKINAPE
jgi:hypothetical protein